MGFPDKVTGIVPYLSESIKTLTGYVNTLPLPHLWELFGVQEHAYMAIYIFLSALSETSVHFFGAPQLQSNIKLSTVVPVSPVPSPRVCSPSQEILYTHCDKRFNLNILREFVLEVEDTQRTRGASARISEESWYHSNPDMNVHVSWPRLVLVAIAIWRSAPFFVISSSLPIAMRYQGSIRPRREPSDSSR